MFESLINKIEKLELKGCLLILVTLLSIILVGVFFRYVLGRPLTWVTELSIYLVIWLSFLAISLAYKRRAHPMIEAFVRRLSLTAQNYVGMGLDCCIFFLLILVIAASIKLQALQCRFRSEILEIPTNFFSSTPILVSSISMMISTVHFILVRIEKIGAGSDKKEN